ncbi:MAG: HlyD family type I secretion periplasmic adaptor subunit [Flavimaricola sp.]|nr:HlyD family type I secretion periplasmic adaptor subunit [Flavimaricola sp.]
MTAPSKIRLSVRTPLILGMLVLLVLVGGLGSWSVLSRITGAVITQGRIEVEQNRQVIQHPDGGVVAEILVKEGDTVTAGDVLIRLDSETLSGDLAVVEGQLFEVLARRARFEAERDSRPQITFPALLTESMNLVAKELMDGQIRLFEARTETEGQQREQLERRRDQIGNQIDGIRAQQVALEMQLGLLSEELESQQSLLDRGLAQSARVLALRREAANLAGQAGELAAAAAEAEGRITELDIEILGLVTTRREEAISRLRDLQFNEIEQSERRRSLQAQLDRLEIRATVDGVVYGLQVFAARSVIRSADPVMFIIPQDRPLIITVQVQPNDIDQVFVGQGVAVRFSAFDQRRTPELLGIVTQVSADSFTDQNTSLSYYRAQIVLNEGEKDRLPEAMVLVPGMPVEGFLATQERSPLDYLIKPLADYFAKAFREG